ncbi:hypothetical protein RIF29_19595 [Crotalaria pallida]|uniref:Uncharacterized protein n=1 Tax=Crotalaria pallida TaxID=3830 RepID=A0AAN9I6N1_CROPI
MFQNYLSEIVWSLAGQFDVSNFGLSSSEMMHVKEKPSTSNLQQEIDSPVIDKSATRERRGRITEIHSENQIRFAGSLRPTKTRRSESMPSVSESSKDNIEEQFDLAGSSRTTNRRRCRAPALTTESSKKNIEEQVNVAGSSRTKKRRRSRPRSLMTESSEIAVERGSHFLGI